MERRNSIPMWRKQEIIDWIENHGGGIPSRAIGHFRQHGLAVDGAAVRKWWREREKIMAADPHRRRVSGGGRKPVSSTMKDLLFDELMDKRLRNEKVTRTWISDMGAAIYVSLGDNDTPQEPFAASNHWVDNFMKRDGLSLRRRTNLTILTDEVLVDRAVSYMKFLQEHKTRMDLSQTVLMDETAVYFEDARTQTIDVVGARHVVMRSTGFASMQITAMLAVTAAGKKLVPTLIWKGKDKPSFEKVDGVLVTYQSKAWVDSALLKRWIGMQFPIVNVAPGKYLVWDSMRAHISKGVKAKCQTRGIAMCVVPGGLTPYLQAGDIGIYRQFKDILYAEINAWMESDQDTYTKFGNPRPPPVSTVSGWVRKAWAGTDASVVINSVNGAGFAAGHRDWFIARQDVYGSLFNERYNGDNGVEGDPFNFEELDDALDEDGIITDE